MLSENFRSQVSDLLAGSRNMAECQFSDKNLAGAVEKIDRGIAELMNKYPNQ